MVRVPEAEGGHRYECPICGERECGHTRRCAFGCDCTLAPRRSTTPDARYADPWGRCPRPPEFGVEARTDVVAQRFAYPVAELGAARLRIVAAELLGPICRAYGAEGEEATALRGALEAYDAAFEADRIPRGQA